MRRLLGLVFVCSLLVPVGMSAQSFAVAVQAGSIGLGGSAIYGVTPKLNVRGTFGIMPYEPDFTVDEVDFTSDLPAFLRATVDFYPVGFFYLSGGGLFVTKSGDIGVDGTFTGSQDFGGNTYTSAEVGTLLGVFSLAQAMPYLGVGFGNPIGRRIGVSLDLGVGIGSTPTVDLAATGPIASDPTFAAGLEEREAEFQADIPEVLKYYPVISLALSFGVGG